MKKEINETHKAIDEVEKADPKAMPTARKAGTAATHELLRSEADDRMKA